MGRGLAMLMHRRAMNQSELAKLSGVSQSMISMLLNGKRQTAHIEVVKALAYALGAEELTPSAGSFLTSLPIRIKDFQDFMATDLGRSLNIGQEEKARITGRAWYFIDERPSDIAWYDFVRACRSAIKPQA